MAMPRCCCPSPSSLRQALTPLAAPAIAVQVRSAVRVPRITRKMRHPDLDAVVSRHKGHDLAFTVKEFLLRAPGHAMTIQALSRFRTQLRLRHGTRLSHLLRRYPRLFRLYENEGRQLCCCFAKDGAAVARQETRVRTDYGAAAVPKLRKLLMMAVDRRILVHKLTQLRHDLGIPEGFQKNMVHEYPQFFRVVDAPEGPLLELTAWDDSLAVTELEAQQAEARHRTDAPAFKISIPKSITLPREQRIALTKFQMLPFLSPYADATAYKSSQPEFEKRNVALIHEILSMAVEKRTTVDYLTHFRPEFRLPQSVLRLLLRHPGIFYVSRRDDRLSVFLKEAYNGMNLVQRSGRVSVKQRYMQLMKPSSKAKGELNAAEAGGACEQESSDGEFDASYFSDDESD